MKRIILFSVVLVLLIGMGAGACGGRVEEEAAPTPAPTLPTPPTPTPEAEKEAAPTPYPWASIFILEHLPRKGNVLEVIVDFSRQLSSDEIESLKEKIKLIDEDGREYHPSSHSTRGGTIKHGPDISWHADLAYSFLFEVESESSSYTLSWPDYPPLAVGNPFKSPFLLESRAPTPTPTPVPTPTPTPTPSKPHFTSDDGRIEFALDNVDRTKVWPAELRMSELEGSVPKKGYDFIVVYVTIVRITDGHVDSSTGSTLIDDEGGEYQGYRGLQCSWTTAGIIPYQQFELPEGSEGKFIYEVPENVEPVKLRLAYLLFESWSESGQREFEEERYLDIILP